jgi:hypothetical protein
LKELVGHLFHDAAAPADHAEERLDPARDDDAGDGA